MNKIGSLESQLMDAFKEKEETWVEGYKKWKKERCPHN